MSRTRLTRVVELIYETQEKLGVYGPRQPVGCEGDVPLAPLLPGVGVRLLTKVVVDHLAVKPRAPSLDRVEQLTVFGEAVLVLPGVRALQQWGFGLGIHLDYVFGDEVQVEGPRTRALGFTVLERDSIGIEVLSGNKRDGDMRQGANGRHVGYGANGMGDMDMAVNLVPHCTLHSMHSLQLFGAIKSNDCLLTRHLPLRQCLGLSPSRPSEHPVPKGNHPSLPFTR